MARKSRSDQLASAISNRLAQMGPENCETIEQAVANDATISRAFGMEPTTTADYDICPACRRPRYRGICHNTHN